MIHEWSEEAKFELTEAAAYYQRQESGLGDSFIDQVEAAARKIIRDPFSHREFDPPYCRVHTERFPYQVIYVIEDETVYIMAVMHQKRRLGCRKELS
ncbi:MAG: plasmid stabilization system protein ParE [Verrucomicrobiales bacterium]|jgi:plasmid stabilization system protein ParE